jgi:ribosome-binding protein aMBF1 (putative translation factor)
MSLLHILAEAANPTPGGADWFQTYGVWGIIVTLGGVISAMAVYIKSLTAAKPEAERQLAEQEAQTKIDALLEEVRETLEPAVTTIRELKEFAHEVLNKTVDKKDSVITELARQKDAEGEKGVKKMEELYTAQLELLERVIKAVEDLGKADATMREQLAEIRKLYAAIQTLLQKEDTDGGQ